MFCIRKASRSLVVAIFPVSWTFDGIRTVSRTLKLMIKHQLPQWQKKSLMYDHKSKLDQSLLHRID